MSIKLKDLLNKYEWAEIVVTYQNLHPNPPKNIAAYEEAYDQLKKLRCIPVSMKIRINLATDEFNGKYYVDIYGTSGETFRNFIPPKHQAEYERQLDEERHFGFSYIDWSEFIGMEISGEALEKFSEQEILSHCQSEIAVQWHGKEELAKVQEELENIKSGTSKLKLTKKEKQYNGFLSLWHEMENGSIHGESIDFRDSGPIMCQKGIIVDGYKEGIWTHWNREGKFKEQVLYDCDKVKEVINKPPWLDNAKDRSLYQFKNKGLF